MHKYLSRMTRPHAAAERTAMWREVFWIAVLSSFIRMSMTGMTSCNRGMCDREIRRVAFKKCWKVMLVWARMLRAVCTYLEDVV